MDEPATFVAFAALARSIAGAARCLGLAVPAFRSPPGLAGADRTLRRRADGTAVVAVRIRGRPLAALAADMVEGVIAANRLPPERAGPVRQHLLGVGDASGGRHVA